MGNKKTGPDVFGKALEDTLAGSKSERRSSSTRSLSQTALLEAYNELEKRIKRPFACGGTINITDNQDSRPKAKKQKRNAIPGKTSPPVRLFWATETGATAHKLVLPADSTSVLQKLIKDCVPATFGRGKKDVLDPEYRRAVKMDPNNFATSFHPANFGIVENVERILLPRINTEKQNSLGFRKLRVELYSLNVYSGPSGLFRKHVDTPRSKSQIGSLVVCLPSKFKGGRLTVQHARQHSKFDWSTLSDAAIQWAAFYSDCKHEIETVTEGERLTLTYNLYVTEPLGVFSAPNNIIQPKSLPLYGFLEGLIAEPAFMRLGGVLGVYCSHAYPHSSEHASDMLPIGLKGADLVVYSVLESLGMKVKVLPVLNKNQGPVKTVGKKLWGCSMNHQEVDWGYYTIDKLLDGAWDAYRTKDITWISNPKHLELALAYPTYGNEPSLDTAYSYAAILAIIPPFDQRSGSAESS